MFTAVWSVGAKFKYSIEAVGPMAFDVIVAGRVESETVVIREFSPSLIDDWLLFWDDPAWIRGRRGYCACHHLNLSEDDWKMADEHRRDSMVNLVKAGKVHGLLAYLNGRPVAWCNVEPRRPPGLDKELATTIPIDTSERVGIVACLLTAKAYRGHGIARQLLNAACEKLKQQGFAFAEAYADLANPPPNTPKIWPLSMFLNAGFKPFKEDEWGVIVRKEL